MGDAVRLRWRPACLKNNNNRTSPMTYSDCSLVYTLSLVCDGGLAL